MAQIEEACARQNDSRVCGELQLASEKASIGDGELTMASGDHGICAAVHGVLRWAR